MGCDPFGIDHDFRGRDLQVQVRLVHSPAGASGCAKRRPSPVAGVTVDLADAITITLPRPCPSAMAHRGVSRVATVRALPRIRREHRAVRWDVRSDQRPAGACVRTIAAPQELLARVARDEADEGRPIVGRRPGPLPLLGTSAWRIRGVAMGCAGLPRRSDPVRLPRRRCLSGRRWTPCCANASGGAAVGYGVASVIALAHVPSGPSARPWPFHAAAAPGWPVVAGLSRRPVPVRSVS
jgi:hypothetical protein